MRFLRKHRVALVAIAAANFVLFFPVLFMGRVLSPNDVFLGFEPWSIGRGADVQNFVINDPPTAYYTLMSLMKSGEAFQWNPYVASGIPGWGSSAAAVLSPFIAIPVLLLPLVWSYTAIVFLKLNVAFWLAYLWLREERLGKRGAAIGAIAFAASGAFAVRWLWQVTNATALYPALSWIASRTARGKRVPVLVTAIVALAYALAGFPATMAYGAYAAIAYFVFLALRERRLALRPLVVTSLAVVLAIIVAAPSLVPFVKFVQRSGYLAMRETLANATFPLHHLAAFARPDLLGNPAYHKWNGDPSLPVNNYVEATIYIGIVTLPLVLLALFARRARSRWFWIVACVLIAGAMFGMPVVARVAASLPGIKYSPLTRLQLVLPLAVAYLAAAGSLVVTRTRFATLIAATLAVLIAADLAIFAGRFHPYVEPKDAGVPTTPTIAYLQSEPRPFRIAPMFNYLWPNSAELLRIEDIRSHFSSEAAYRRMMQRIDPSAWSGTSTMISFNSLHFDFTDPLLGMLGVRYFIEQPSIDIIRWKIFEATRPVAKETGNVTLPFGQTMERTITVGDEPFWALELPVKIDATLGATPRVIVTLVKNGQVVWTRSATPEDCAALGKLYAPVRPFARAGESLTLRVESLGVRASLLVVGKELYYGRVTIPLIFDRALPDGRLFLNVAETPRFHVVPHVRAMTDEQFFATKAIDFADEAIVTPGAALPHTGEGSVQLVTHSASWHELVTRGDAPFFIASSEKLTPELRVTIDGRAATPVPINVLFAGVEVPAGEHRVVFSRRIAGGGWWVASAASAVLLLALAWITRRRG